MCELAFVALSRRLGVLWSNFAFQGNGVLEAGLLVTAGYWGIG